MSYITLHSKRLFLIILSVFSFHLSLSAQPRLRTPEIYFGVHGGVTASTVMFRPSVPNMTPITQACVLGGNGGFVFRYAGHKYCAFEVELNYMHRGWREYSAGDASLGIADDSYNRELHYIELPLLMNINFGSQQWRGFFNFGPQIGICVFDNGGKGIHMSDNKTQYASPIDQRFDWGLAGGLGFYFRSRNAGLYQLEARFSYSFGGVFGTSLTDYFDMASPMDLSINLAWLWEFKRKKRSAPVPIQSPRMEPIPTTN